MCWQEFTIGEVFHIKSGKHLTKSDMQDGKTPFIGASEFNNGVTEFIANHNESLDKNILGVNWNGSVADNFYHPYTAIFSGDVKKLSLKNVQGNKYLYLFIKNSILQQKEKYGYGYKFNEQRMKKQKIMLPVDETGKPNYHFMEQFMLQQEINQLIKYQSYLYKSYINIIN